MDFALLERLVQTPGVSGREERVRELIETQFGRLKAVTTIDAMGNVVGHLPGHGPRVALMAHMDEVGFLVSKIEPEGFIRVMPVGGVNPRVFGAQKVMVHGRKDLSGIVGSIPPHLLKSKGEKERNAALPIEESFIDLGLTPKEVNALVNLGDPVTFATGEWQNENAFFGKALDDRLGLFVMLQAVQQAAKIDCDLFLLATTQEEYGLRGVGPAVFPLEPQIVIALEGTVATDTPGLKLPPNTAATVQGGGPEIRLTDGRMISHRPLADALVQIATKSKIPHQIIVKNTGATDAAAGQITAAGSKACTVSVPVRYLHAPISMVRKADAIETVRLVSAFLEQAADLSL